MGLAGYGGSNIPSDVTAPGSGVIGIGSTNYAFAALVPLPTAAPTAAPTQAPTNAPAAYMSPAPTVVVATAAPTLPPLIYLKYNGSLTFNAGAERTFDIV